MTKKSAAVVENAAVIEGEIITPAATVDEHILDAVDAKLDALEAINTANTANTAISMISGPGNEDGDEAKSFETLYALLSDQDKLDKAVAIGRAFDDRITWLKTNKPNNTTQAPKLDNYRKKLALPSKAGVLLVSGTSEEFINRSISEGSIYNLYAIDKVIDFVNGLSGDRVKNAINRAVLKSMMNFKAEGIAFTGEMARAAASNKIRIQDKKAESLLMRHTVDAGTAPTQASSTMAALQTLGVVVNKGSMRSPVYELVDTPVTRKLESLLAAA